MNALGKHFLLELKDCDREVLNDIGFLKNTLLVAASEAGATVLGESFHQFSPQGVSGVVVIAESHLTIHTWPEYEYAAIDLFVCGTINPHLAVPVLEDGFQPHKIEVREFKRGILP